MQTPTRHILFLALCMACISMVYFMFLPAQLPFYITAGLVVIIAVLVQMKLHKWLSPQPKTDISTLTVAVLAIGMIYLGHNMYLQAEKYGGWDASAIWNYHARAMTDGNKWTAFLSAGRTHPDYPLFLPSFNAFFMRLIGGNSFIYVPVVTAILITCSIAGLMYAELRSKGFVVACIALYLLVTDKVFIGYGVSQYADTAVALFLLCLMVSVRHAKDDATMLALAAAFAGTCMWVKNEGLIIALVFFVFNARTFLQKRNILYSVAGIAIPLICWLVFKVFFAPKNDMVSAFNHDTLMQALSGERYNTIWNCFVDNMDQKFYYMKVLFALYIAVCVWRRRWPSREMLVLLTCLLIYLSIYVFTTMDLAWHLGTSLHRLMHQLMPAALFVILAEFAELLRSKVRIFNFSNATN